METVKKYAPVDEPRAIQYIKNGRDALTQGDFQNAMRNFKKCYKSRITKKLAVILLNQMAFCMDQLEFYDQQQTFLEELCDIELNFNNVLKLMKIYNETNNEVKRSKFAERIKLLTTEDENEKKQIIYLF